MYIFTSVLMAVVLAILQVVVRVELSDSEDSPLLFAVLAFVIAPILTMALTDSPPRIRTARGRAYYEQIRGFREYISTAKVNQLRLEAGQDIFSKYLPWAIIFGETKRWTDIFAQLAAAGQYEFTPRWYVATPTASVSRAIRNAGESMAEFSGAGMTGLLHTPGGSGGSGSFGRGFSGGGVGGGRFGGR